MLRGRLTVDGGCEVHFKTILVLSSHMFEDAINILQLKYGDAAMTFGDVGWREDTIAIEGLSMEYFLPA